MFCLKKGISNAYFKIKFYEVLIFSVHNLVLIKSSTFSLLKAWGISLFSLLYLNRDKIYLDKKRMLFHFYDIHLKPNRDRIDLKISVNVTHILLKKCVPSTFLKIKFCL